MKTIPEKPVGVIARAIRSFGVLLAILLTACSSLPSGSPDSTPDVASDTSELNIASRYWEYATLAAYVYKSRGKPPSTASLISNSPWLNEELESMPEKKQNAQALLSSRLQQKDSELARFIGDECDSIAYASDRDVQESDARFKDCQKTATARWRASEYGTMRTRIPALLSDCDYHREARDETSKDPYIPYDQVIAAGWKPVPELQRRVHPRNWSIFIPGLAIDVWRSRIGDDLKNPSVEYAIVYRGTDGKGGMVSNFRTVLAFTPFVWDQYRQAIVATRDIVDQIIELHATSDIIFERTESSRKTRMTITSIGHSLGGGIATYVYLTLPEIDRVVGFDASPIDGSSVVSEENRNVRLARRSRQTPIHLIYEKGSILEKLSACRNGTIWGSDGPAVRCELVNLSHGAYFDQHNMAQMACKMYFIKTSAPTIASSPLGPSSIAYER